MRTAAVAVHQHPTAGETLVAHVVAGDDKFDIEAAKKALAAKVPPYMVPPVWQMHETLPRLASGKVDRKALAVLPITTAVDQGEQEEPRTPTEAKLLAAAKSVLGPAGRQLRQRLLHRPRRPLADRGAVRLGAAQDTRARLDRAAGRVLAAHAAQDRRRARPAGGRAGKIDISFEPPPLLPPLPVRPRPGDRAAVHHRDRHRAVDRPAAVVDLSRARRDAAADRGGDRCARSTSRSTSAPSSSSSR